MPPGRGRRHSPHPTDGRGYGGGAVLARLHGLSLGNGGLEAIILFHVGEQLLAISADVGEDGSGGDDAAAMNAAAGGRGRRRLLDDGALRGRELPEAFAGKGHDYRAGALGLDHQTRALACDDV